MICQEIRDECPLSEGFIVKDLYQNNRLVWLVDVSDLLENYEISYELRFIKHHGRVDFVKTEMNKYGVCSTSFKLTPELESKIEEFITKKLG